LQCTDKGRRIVDEYLAEPGLPEVLVVGVDATVAAVGDLVGRRLPGFTG
jgi:hypothetical protein